MKCPNCKATIDDNSKFCDYCGKKIEENTNKPSIKKDEITIEEYYRHYIGDNYYNFKNKFNIFALIFGGLYIFYRKQYLFGALFIIITILSILFSPIIAIILHLLLGLTFNQNYLRYINKKSRQIKMKNLDKSKEEILRMCSERGGTSFLSAMFSVIVVLVIVIIILNIGGTNLKGNKGKTIIKVSNNKISNLIFEVPSKFEPSNYNTDTYRSYTYNEDKNYCRIKIETRKDNKKYASIEEFITNNIPSNKTDTVTAPENITINKQLWKRIMVKNSAKTITYYTTKYNELYYIISYDLYNNDSICNEEYNNFMNTLNFRDK